MGKDLTGETEKLSLSGFHVAAQLVSRHSHASPFSRRIAPDVMPAVVAVALL